MKDKEILSVLQDVHALIGAPVIVCREDGIAEACIPDAFFGVWVTEKACLLYHDMVNEGRDAMVWYAYPFFYTILLVLPEECRMVCIGPLSVKAITEEQAHALALEYGLAHEKVDAFVERLCSVSPVSYSGIIGLARLLCRMLMNREVLAEDIHVQIDYSPKTDIEPAISRLIFDRRESVNRHISLCYERDLLERVRSGNVDALAGLTGSDGGTVGEMSLNPLNQAKYTFISLVTLLARVAIDSGVDDEMAFSLSDALSQKMDAMRDPAAVQAISEEALVVFTQRIGAARGKSLFSPPVQKSCDYINTHLHEDIPLNVLADAARLSPRTLSARFRHEVGVKIVDYIAQQRVNEAKSLLKHTDYSLGDIAQFLHFSSQSYFTLLFRRMVGVTPQVYRDARRGLRAASAHGQKA